MKSRRDEERAQKAGRRAVVRRLGSVGAVAVLGGVLFWSLGHEIGSLAGAIALISPLLLLAAAACFRRVVHEGWDRRAILAAGIGAPRDGDWVAVCGEARAVGEPTESPLSGKPVLAAWYQVREWTRFVDEDRRRRSRSTHHTGKVNRSGSLRFEGFRLVPMWIESLDRTVRLRGFPDLTFRQPKAMAGGPDFRPDRAEHKENAVSPGMLGFASRARVLAGPRDHCEIDWKHGDLADPSEMNRLEYRLEPGETVCACGVQEGETLVPSPERPNGLPVYTGSPETVVRDLEESIKVWKILGGLCFVGAVALVVGGLTVF